MPSDSRKSCTHEQIQIPMVGPMPIEPAIIEIIELLVLLLHKVYDRPNLYGLHIKVKIRTIGLNTGGDQAWFCVRVKCSDLQENLPSLGEILPAFGKAVIKILQTMQNIFPGEFLWIENTDESCQRTLLWYMLMEENQVFRKRIEKKAFSADTPATRETSFCLKIVQSKEHMAKECENLCNYLHRLKILSPFCVIQFYLNVWGVISSSKFDWKSLRSCLSHRRIASDIEHYLEKEAIPDGVDRISPRLGGPYTLPGLKHRFQKESIRLTSIAAIVPPPLNQEIGTRELNTKCTKLKILLFGPNGIPLILPRVQGEGLCPATITRLEDYGLKIGEPCKKSSNSQEIISADWCYHLKPVEEDWHNTLLDWDEESNVTPEKGYEILLFLILERLKPVLHWTLDEELLLLNAMRQNFLQLFCKQRTKIRKSISNVVNKILQNCANANQKQRLVQRAVYTIASSLCSVLEQSNSLSFQQQCLAELDVNNIRDVKAVITGSLWDVATERLGVEPASSGNASSKGKKAKKRSIEGKDVNKMAACSSFDDLAAAGEMNASHTKTTSTLTAPVETNDQHKGRNAHCGLERAGSQQLLDFLNSASQTDFTAENKSLGTFDESWDILGQDGFLDDLDAPYEIEDAVFSFDLTTRSQTSSKNVPIISDTSLKGASVTEHATASGSSRPTPIGDYLLSQNKDFSTVYHNELQEWLDEFPCDL